MILPEVIPLFPLPSVVLFPRMPLPLHVFEPRYRAMVRDAMRGPRLIGMALLRGDWQRDYERRPEIFAEGTVGEIAHVEELADGRFDIVLRGLREYRIRQELPARAPYREAMVTWREECTSVLPPGMRATVAGRVVRYLERLGRSRSDDQLLESGIDDESFVNFLAQHLELEPLERQGLLEAASLSERARRIGDNLEFRLEELRSHGAGRPGGRAH
jgi:Lon protease-like protein